MHLVVTSPYSRFALLTVAVGLLVFAGDVDLSAQGVELKFVTPDRGKEILATEDDFLSRLSPFDRQARVQSAEPVSQQAYIDFVAKEIRPWDDTTRTRVTEAFALIKPAIDAVLPQGLPPVEMIRTTGREEGGAAYTRSAAIVLPTARIREDRGALAKLLAHELFHVLSRRYPKLRDSLYGVVGFQKVNEILLPESLRERRLTNPDAPVIQHIVQVRNPAGKEIYVAPVLFSKSPYDLEKNRLMFAYLNFQLMEVQSDASGQFSAVLTNGMPNFLTPNTPDYGRKLGRNTGYIIHPEEVLADNFKDLVTGRTDAPDPWVTTKMKAVFAAGAQN